MPPLALFVLLTACQTPPLTGKAHCPPVPEHLLTDEPAPVFNFPADASSGQVIEQGIRPLHQWGAEGWARVRQIRMLQQECSKDRRR